jgi:UMF1 family MFS transporter
MYDWANSAFITTVMASVFPLYFAMIAKPTLGDNTSAAWGYTTSIALFITA